MIFVIWAFSSNYVPFGSNYAISGKEEFTYTGKSYDLATGLYYYGARYYDATTGRFVTQDDYPGSKIDPMSMNLYIYARDNPERMVDPNGHVFIASATMIDGMIARKWLALPLVCSTATDYTDINKVSYKSSPSTLTIGTSAKSVDVMLTEKEVNQYANAPTIGTTSNQKGTNPLGALAVIGAGLALGLVSFWGGIQVAAKTSFEIGGLRTIGIAADISDVVDPIAAGAIPLFATGWAIGYAIRTMQSGQTPTFQGAVSAFWQGIEVAVTWQPP